MDQTIFFRADGNYSIGFGHVYRLYSLANYLKDKFKCVFLSRELPETLKRLLHESSILHHCIEEDNDTLSILADQHEPVLILDGYEFQDDYLQALFEQGVRMVKVDDFFECDSRFEVTVNHAVHAQRSSYDSNKCRQFLLGADYIMLRDHFLQKASASDHDPVSQIRNVFVCFGGADPRGVAIQVCSELLADRSIENIHLVSRFDREQLPADPRIRIHFDLDETAMIDLMRECQFAIVPPSTISLELCAVRIPMVLIPVEENQLGIYQGLLAKQCGIGLEPDHIGQLRMKMNELSVDDLVDMQTAQSSLIDGQSKRRFLEFFENFV